VQRRLADGAGVHAERQRSLRSGPAALWARALRRGAHVVPGVPGPVSGLAAGSQRPLLDGGVLRPGTRLRARPRAIRARRQEISQERKGVGGALSQGHRLPRAEQQGGRQVGPPAVDRGLSQVRGLPTGESQAGLPEMRRAILLTVSLILGGCVPTADFVDLRDEVRRLDAESRKVKETEAELRKLLEEADRLQKTGDIAKTLDALEAKIESLRIRQQGFDQKLGELLRRMDESARQEEEKRPALP